MLKSIPRKIKNVQRSRQIANVLIKNGFGHVIERLDLRLPLVKKAKTERERMPAPVRVRLVLEELGPTFVKFGQILSMRPELVPPEYVEELRKLQDDVPGFPYESVEEEIKKDLGSPVDEIFDSFDRQPIAAASVSQVHHAILNGVDVVVKVQRPGIEEDIEADIDILYNLARLMARHIPESALYDPVGIVGEFAKSIRKELDFMVEARNADKFRRNFSGYEGVYVPPVYWEATSKRILTLEMIRGKKLSECCGEVDAQAKKKLADLIAKSYMKQLFVDGFFHGDPHPGNILIVDKEIIAFMDFGIMGRVDEYMKDKLSGLFIAVIQKNKERIVDELLDIGVTGDDTSIPEFRTDISELIEEYYGTSLKQVDVSAMLNDVLKTALRHRIKIPANFALLIKTLVAMEGLCRELSSDFNLTEASKPFVENLAAERVQPGRVLRRFMESFLDFNENIGTLPKKIGLILSKLQEGKLVIDLEHKGLNRLISEIDASSNRLSASLIIAAVIVGSSVVILADKGPHYMDYPVIGILGFVLAGILGFFLVLSILRSGRF